MKFGLALSGGGLRGGAHIGVLKALEEVNLHPSWISGTSAGSIVAGLYACGYAPKEMEDLVSGLGRSLYDPDIFGLVKGISQLILGKEPSVSGIIKGKKIEKMLKKWTKGRHIKESRIPIFLTGVDINNGQTIYFVSNKYGLKDDKYNKYLDDVLLHEAIAVSISIPVVFQTKIVDGLRLVDGGVTDSLPSSILKKIGVNKVIGVDLGYSGKMRRDIDNIIEIGGQTLDIMGYQITRLMNSKANYIIYPNIHDVGLTDFDRIPECIQRGYEATKDNMESIIKAIYKR